VADTWDEAACRARLMVAPDPPLSPWVTELRGALAALDAAREECGRLRARLEECRLIGVGESDFVKELLRLKAECGHWQRKWAEGREEVDRLRAALRPFAGFARSGMDPARLPTIADFEAAAAALGGASRD
jgi:hypothetical protein